MSRYTMGNTIERIRRQLNSTVRLELNVLGATLNDTATTLTTEYDHANSLRAGAVLSLGQELMKVISNNVTSKEVVVIRGWLDTRAHAHDLGAEILINPRFTRADIIEGIIQEVETWSPDIFKVADEVVSLAVASEGYEVSSTYANALGVIEVRRNYTEAESVVWPQIDYRLHRGRSATLTPTENSGLFIRLLPPGGAGYLPAASQILARYAVPYNAQDIESEQTDLVLDVGLDPSLLELIELGVKYRLMMDDEIPRSGRGMQDEPRRAEETPVGSTANVAQFMLQRYENRRNQEVMRLRTKYPFRSW